MIIGANVVALIKFLVLAIITYFFMQLLTNNNKKIAIIRYNFSMCIIFCSIYRSANELNYRRTKYYLYESIFMF